MQLTVKEVEDQLKEFQKIIHEYRSADIQFQHTTKEQFIKKLIEKTDILIQAGSFPNLQRKDISSFLYSELRKNEIDISDRYIQQFCSDDQKRKYNQSEIVSERHTHDFILEVDGGVLGLLLQCQCGKFSNGSQELEFITIQPPDKIETLKEVKPDDDLDSYLTLLSDISRMNSNLWSKISSSKKEDEDAAIIIRELFGDIKSKKAEALTEQAKYEVWGSLLDWREKLHIAENLALYIKQGDENLAHIAKMIDFSAKWMHDIKDRVEGKPQTSITKQKAVDEFQETLKIIKEIKSCPACNWSGYYYYLMLNVERQRKGLPSTKPEPRELCCITCKKSMK